MGHQKQVLLIAGGGTLGSFVSEELLKQDFRVDVICLEDKASVDPRLRYFKARATDEYLAELFARQHYDGIVNFLHYKDPDVFKRSYPLLMKGTDHLIFLSSYRVYADRQHPITESAPRLTETVTDPDFLANEDYAVPKCRCEDFLRAEHGGENWTIVRPVISFSQLRLDLFMYSRHTVPERAAAGEPVLLPDFARKLTAGLDWAGNSGKLIAALLCKRHTFGQTYTVSSGQNLTWEQVAQAYTDLTGVKICWVSQEEFLQACPLSTPQKRWMYTYDRVYDRPVDNSAILAATGLKKEVFTPLAEGLRQELIKAGF